MKHFSHPLPLSIEKFIHKHHLLTLSTSDNNFPYCASCFYAFDKRNMRFILSSDPETLHGSQSMKNQNIAGCIALETAIIGKIRGIQFTGTIHFLKEEPEARLVYLKRFPYAALTKLYLWEIIPEMIKFTDNRLGFGKKLYWYRNGSPQE